MSSIRNIPTRAFVWWWMRCWTTFAHATNRTWFLISVFCVRWEKFARGSNSVSWRVSKKPFLIPGALHLLRTASIASKTAIAKSTSPHPISSLLWLIASCARQRRSASRSRTIYPSSRSSTATGMSAWTLLWIFSQCIQTTSRHSKKFPSLRSAAFWRFSHAPSLPWRTRMFRRTSLACCLLTASGFTYRGILHSVPIWM